MKLSLVIPCYNEADNIQEIVRRLKTITSSHSELEVILVDNGSTDSSPQVFKKETEALPPQSIRVVRVESNRGYGHGILKGLEAARGELLAWTHADLQSSPEDIIDALNSYGRNSFIKGRRTNRRPLERFFSKGMELAVYALLGERLTEINAQPKLFSRAFYENHLKSQAPSDFSLDLYALYKAKRSDLEIREIPVTYYDREFGTAKGGGGADFKTRFRLIKRTLSFIFKLRKELRSE